MKLIVLSSAQPDPAEAADYQMLCAPGLIFVDFSVCPRIDIKLHFRTMRASFDMAR
jgi:hypothetical protein